MDYDKIYEEAFNDEVEKIAEEKNNYIGKGLAGGASLGGATGAIANIISSGRAGLISGANASGKISMARLLASVLQAGAIGGTAGAIGGGILGAGAGGAVSALKS